MELTKRPITVSKVIIHAIFIVISCFMVLPFLLVLSGSLTDENTIASFGFEFIPRKFSVLAYKFIFQAPQMLIRAYGVTIFITIVGTVLGLLLTAMIGYSISRRDYRYGRITTFYVFFTMLFNGGLVPYYILMTQYLHVNDTLFALIIPGLLTPFNVMIMKGFMSKIPHELVEAARIDGAGEWHIFFTMILPLSMPALATLGLMISFGYWNEWFNALLFINDNNLVPLQLMLYRIMNTIDFLTSNSNVIQNSSNINLAQLPSISARMAMAVLAAGPMLCVFPFFQRYFVSGLTVGSLKS